MSILYPSRASEVNMALLEDLATLTSADGEKSIIHLTETELQEVLDWEIPFGEKLENISKITVKSSLFCTEYFETEEGKKALEAAGGDLENIPKVAVRTTLAGSARRFAEAAIYSELEQSVMDSGSFDSSQITIPTTKKVIVNTTEIEEKIRKLVELKSELKKEYSPHKLPIDEAKNIILRMHIRKINQLLATDKKALLHSEKNSSRYSKFIYGASRKLIQNVEKEGRKDFSVLPPVLREQALQSRKIFAELAGSEIANITSTGYDYHKLKDNEGEYSFTSEEMADFAERVLEEYGLLSSEPRDSYDPDRVGAAKDNKWQVIINPSATTMSVNGTKKIVTIPGNKRFNVISLIGVLIGHEIEGHVLQNENKSHIPLRLFRKSGAARSMVFAEMGAMSNEDKVKRECFNMPVPFQPDYIFGMEAKEKGGNYADVVKAMYDSHKERIDAYEDKDVQKKEKELALKRAINRAFRIFTDSPNLTTKTTFIANSKDTVYLEQAIIIDELKKHGLEKLAFLGGVNLDAIVDLLRIGLLDIKNIQGPKNIAQKMWSTIEKRYRSDENGQL